MVGLARRPSYLQRSSSHLILIAALLGAKIKSCCWSSGQFCWGFQGVGGFRLDPKSNMTDIHVMFSFFHTHLLFCVRFSSALCHSIFSLRPGSLSPPPCTPYPLITAGVAFDLQLWCHCWCVSFIFTWAAVGKVFRPFNGVKLLIWYFRNTPLWFKHGRVISAPAAACYYDTGLLFIHLCLVGLELTCIYRTAAMDICTAYFLKKPVKQFKKNILKQSTSKYLFSTAVNCIYLYSSSVFDILKHNATLVKRWLVSFIFTEFTGVSDSRLGGHL